LSDLFNIVFAARNDGDRLGVLAAQKSRRGAGHLRNLSRFIIASLAATN